MRSYLNNSVLKRSKTGTAITVASLSLAVTVLAGCGNKPPACGDEQNLTLVKQIFNEELAASNTQPSQDTGWLEKFKQGSTINFTTIRTTSVDEKIGKVSCAATMVTTFPEGANKLLGSSILPDAFKKDYPGLNMKVNGLALSTDIQYSSQMTDDNKNLLVEVTGLKGVVEIASVSGRSGLFLAKAAPDAATTATTAETPSTAAPQAAQSTQTAINSAGVTTAQATDNDKKTTLRGGKLSIVGEMNQPKLLLNGKKLLEPESFGLDIVKSFSVGETDVVLVMNNSGGTACPAHFFFVSVTSQGVARVSPEFGTCSDLAEPTLDGSSISVTMPKMNGRGKAKYLYANGTLTENGKLIKEVTALAN